MYLFNNVLTPEAFLVVLVVSLILVVILSPPRPICTWLFGWCVPVDFLLSSMGQLWRHIFGVVDFYTCLPSASIEMFIMLDFTRRFHTGNSVHFYLLRHFGFFIIVSCLDSFICPSCLDICF